MALFDKPYTTFYWSASVNIPLSCTIFQLFDVEQYRDLEVWVRGHSKSFKLVPFKSFGAVSYSPSIVTILHHFRDKARYWSKIVIFFSYPVAFDTAIRMVLVGLLPSCLAQKNYTGGATWW